MAAWTLTARVEGGPDPLVPAASLKYTATDSVFGTLVHTQCFCQEIQF
jgi:hypothetical protein